MSNNIRIAPHALGLLVLISLGAGAAAGYVLTSAAKKAPAVPDDATNVVQRVSVKVPYDATLRAQADAERLRERVGELEKLLEEREASLKKLMATSQDDRPQPPLAEVRPQNGEQDERPRWERWREEREARLKRMKTEDPEAYEAEMKRQEEWRKRQEEWRARVREDNQNRNNFLAAIDTSTMTAEQKRNHDDLVAALAVRDSFGERLAPDAENPLTAEERGQFFESISSIGPLMEKERRYILEEVGKAYGEDGESFADYIQTVYDTTSPFGGMGARPPRGPGRPRNGGSRGGDR